MHDPRLSFDLRMVLATSRTWQTDPDHANQGKVCGGVSGPLLGLLMVKSSDLVAEAMEAVGTMSATSLSPIVEATHGRIIGKALPRWSASICNRRIWA